MLPIQLKQSGNKVTLLVASSAVEEFYRLRGLRATAALADTSWLPFKVRELHLVKGPAGYGFLLKEDDCSSGGVGEGGRGGQFVPEQGTCEGWEELPALCLHWDPVPTCTRGPAEPVPPCEHLSPPSALLWQASSCGMWMWGCRPSRQG